MQAEDDKLSCYILTHNSERYLERILTAVRSVVDDLVLVDSGSVDRTRRIAERFDARFIHRHLDDFKSQRNFALRSCRCNWIWSLDSDEVPDEELVNAIMALKTNGFRVNSDRPDAFYLKRRWFVLGREVHAFYPVVTPDYRILLFRKNKVSYTAASTLVHETPTGYTTTGSVSGSISHYSCDSRADLDRKLNLYASLAARDMRNKGKRVSVLKILRKPLFASIKWYVLKGGWKDGRVGLVLGGYAYKYTLKKYLELRRLERTDPGAQPG